MKTIFLLRHAKSSWDDITLDDFDRPLSHRGIKSCEKIGNFINYRFSFKAKVNILEIDSQKYYWIQKDES